MLAFRHVDDLKMSLKAIGWHGKNKMRQRNIAEAGAAR